MAIMCTKYEPSAESKQCRHYVDNDGYDHVRPLCGACSLPDELMCVEWERRYVPHVEKDKVLVLRRKVPR